MNLEYIQQSFADNEKITGHLAYLDETRLVFIGKREGQSNCWYIGFRNAKGEDTKLTLSLEAMALLVQLYNKPPKGTDTFPLQIKGAWKVTEK